MRIAIDLTALLPEATGVDNYLKNLVLNLGRVDERNRYRIFVNYEDRHVFQNRLPGNFSVLPLSVRPRGARLFFQQAILPFLSTVWGADVVHSPSFIMPVYQGRARHVLTVHDMTSFSLPACHIPLRRSALYRRLVRESIRRAELVLVPSHFTAQAICDLVPRLPTGRIRVIRYGIGEEFRPSRSETVQEVVTRLRLPQPYVLYVGTVEPRKNLKRLIESYRRLIASGEFPEHLVLAGRLGWGYKDLLALINAPELRGRIRVTGYIAQNDLPALYTGATLFVYPSLQEGFGFPPLEAMGCGVPTVSSRSSSLVENLQGAAELVAPDDIEALTNAMKRLLQDKSLHAKRKAQGLKRAATFRWEGTARQTLACYRAVVEKHWLDRQMTQGHVPSAVRISDV